jgi:RND superfamily putative drug exporter
LERCHRTAAILGWIAFVAIAGLTVLSGLSMDYRVFILSRVREAYDTRLSTGRAVAHAIVRPPAW